MQSSTSTHPRVAIVTGGAQGIGRSIALRLAEDGFDVAINDLTSKLAQINEVVDEVRGKGRKSVALPGDVTVEEDVAEMVGKTVDHLGGVDVMVANAGIANGKPLLDFPTELFKKHLDINVVGVFLCFKYAAAQMIQQGRGGRLLVASSICGQVATPNLSAYCATKFAVRGLMQSTAMELRDHNITVNAYAPGLIRTPMTMGSEGRSWTGEEGMRARFLKVTDLPASTPDADPSVIASTVLYLCKPEAYFITGQTIGVNGGVVMT